ncbi:hypothetical protein LTR04_007277 [Oleoguttula sp. CCFEE 6159]|nr:hypothetical protein LTR04_007277 [Oleoguttula sp. CCFEE 6159]
MGQGKQYREAYYPSEYSETDYQFFFLVTLGDYYVLTSDTALLGKYWNGTKFLVETMVDRYLDPVSGLFAGSDAFWFTAQGTQNPTAPTALFAIALLWSDALGAYRVSLTQSQANGLLATTYTIRAGIANTTQATKGLEKLSDLFYQIGYKDSSTIGNGRNTQLSPNVQGFLLESLFLAHTQLNVSATTVVPVIKNLLDVFWPTMLHQNQYHMGAPWEYLFPDGSPGIGIFTSLSHPWGGAPTYVLSDYVLGVRREMNATTETYGWVFDPVWEIVEGLRLQWAKGRVPLMGGGLIEAKWSLRNGMG